MDWEVVGLVNSGGASAAKQPPRAVLSDLVVTPGKLPKFSPDTVRYVVDVTDPNADTVTVVPFAQAGVRVTLNGMVTESGRSHEIALPLRSSNINTTVLTLCACVGDVSTSYTVALARKKKGMAINFARIYPGIGLGRVGNSPNEVYIGPEAPGTTRASDDPYNPDGEPFSYKDAQGRLKRQAVRFRVFGYDNSEASNGYYAAPERELTLDDPEIVSISWSVTLANKKGSAFVIGSRFSPSLVQRNSSITDRESLNIRPSPHSVSGRNVNAAGGDPSLQFDDGTFLGTNVNLGELRTDGSGRLLVCSGHGDANFTVGGQPLNNEILNNDFWWDDVADGPVTCTIQLANGNTIIADRAWCVTAPPKYAPQLSSLNIYQVVRELHEDMNLLNGRPRDCVYYRDIHPIFSPATHTAWINQSAHTGHRDGLATLEIPTFQGIDPPTEADRSEEKGQPDVVPSGTPPSRKQDEYMRLQVALMNANADRRRAIFARVRKPLPVATPEEATAEARDTFMPQLAGDGGFSLAGSVRGWFHVTQHQWQKLSMWADGDFTEGEPEQIVPLHELPLGEQPAAMDRAALEPALAGPLIPGIEFTFNVVSNTLYRSAFRISDQFYEAGDVGETMSEPWQSDFWACTSGFFGNWWPSSRPDEVIPLEAYLVQGPNSIGYDLARADWDRGIAGMQDFADNWHKLGVIQPMPGRDGFNVFVESERDPLLSNEDAPHPELTEANLRKVVPERFPATS